MDYLYPWDCFSGNPDFISWPFMVICAFVCWFEIRGWIYKDLITILDLICWWHEFLSMLVYLGLRYGYLGWIVIYCHFYSRWYRWCSYSKPLLSFKFDAYVHIDIGAGFSDNWYDSSWHVPFFSSIYGKLEDVRRFLLMVVSWLFL